MAERLDLSGVFAARYPGKCWTCSEPFQPGDPIRCLEGQAYLHEGCAVESEPPSVPPCQVCWQVPAASGACGCDP